MAVAMVVEEKEEVVAVLLVLVAGQAQPVSLPGVVEATTHRPSSIPDGSSSDTLDY